MSAIFCRAAVSVIIVILATGHLYSEAQSDHCKLLNSSLPVNGNKKKSSQFRTKRTDYYNGDDDNPVISRNIVGGTALPKKSWPFLVALLTSAETIYINREFWTLNCGATLIHPQYLLTAAHCFTQENKLDNSWHYLPASSFVARIGEYDMIKHTNPDAGYRFENGNDIAVAKLDRPVNYTDWIQAACLPKSNSPPPSYNSQCLVAGWGSKSKDAWGGSSYPRVATLRVPEMITCYNALEIPSSAQDGRMFCASDVTGTNDSCAGDSGGPLFCQREKGNWELSGVVSFGGEDCANPAVPGAYTTVSYYTEWVESVISGLPITIIASSDSNNQPTNNNKNKVVISGGNACNRQLHNYVLLLTSWQIFSLLGVT